MTHPPGAVLVPCQETARYHLFTNSLVGLDLPEGSRIVFGMGTSIVQNLNNMLRQLRPEEEWVWILGDDHVFEKDTLTRLLDRDVDMVVPLCNRRGPPFPLVHYGDLMFEDQPYRHVLQFDQIPGDGELFEAQASGSLMLIRRHVLDAVGDPWFETTSTRYDEEFQFCDRVRAAGFSIWVDPAVQVGHISEVVTYPSRQNDAWGLRVEFVGADSWDVFYPGGMRGAEMSFV